MKNVATISKKKAGVLYIVRGYQGSGKSTLAAKILSTSTAESTSTAKVYCADDYHVDKDGSYRFDPTQARKYFTITQDFIAQAMVDKYYNVIIVDGCNASAKDMYPHVSKATKLGWEVVFVYPETSWAWDPEECAKKTSTVLLDSESEGSGSGNGHNIPVDAILRTAKKFVSADDCTVDYVLKHGGNLRFPHPPLRTSS